MKKVFVTLLIVGIVAALHYFVIRAFFKGDGVAVPPPIVQNEDIRQSEGILTARKPLLRFDYSNAVVGTIPELPESAKPRTGILVDIDTGNVLWAKAPKKAVPIASMTKMMTALLAFEDEKMRGDINMDTVIQITKTAAAIGGSQIYLDPRESFTFAELLKAVMITSANDASQQLAEFLGNGDVNQFVSRMNARGKELNMPLTRFYNPHGLPAKRASDDNVSTAEAMVIVARELLDHPQAVEWASTRLAFLPRKDLENPGREKEPTMLHNHNRLVGSSPGVNGMKTGFTQRAKFCVTATCERGGKRLAAVVTGFDTKRGRDSFVAKLLDWGYKKSARTPEFTGSTEDGATSDNVIPK